VLKLLEIRLCGLPQIRRRRSPVDVDHGTVASAGAWRGRGRVPVSCGQETDASLVNSFGALESEELAPMRSAGVETGK
jgi:hypothetical protein